MVGLLLTKLCVKERDKVVGGCVKKIMTQVCQVSCWAAVTCQTFFLFVESGGQAIGFVGR